MKQPLAFLIALTVVFSVFSQSKAGESPCRAGDWYDYKGRKIEDKGTVVKAVSPMATMKDIWNAYRVELPCYFSGCDTMVIPVIIVDSLGRAIRRWDITSYLLTYGNGNFYNEQDSTFGPPGMILYPYKEGRGCNLEDGTEIYFKNDDPCTCCE